MMWLYIVIVFSGVAIVDRWLKNIALNGLTREFGPAQFILYRNDALVFSWPAPNVVAIVLMITALCIVGLVVWATAHRGDRMKVYAGILIFIGALSNIYDRLVYGFVIDWAYLGPWWPVFNLADVLIVVGLIWMLWKRSPRLTKST